MQSMRQKSIELLSANPIDTNALEQVRASQIQFMDEQSKRMSQAMLEAAQVLTPEQRAQLAKMMPNQH
jgi:Spy/CpxP family protein refolding chaperone